jgi:hypothetical protein
VYKRPVLHGSPLLRQCWWCGVQKLVVALRAMAIPLCPVLSDACGGGWGNFSHAQLRWFLLTTGGLNFSGAGGSRRARFYHRGSASWDGLLGASPYG